MLKKLIPDALVLFGVVCVSYGAWLAYPPAGFVVGGALAIYAGMKL